MIKYEGIKVQNQFHFLAFSNELDKHVLIPMEEKEAKRIGLWLNKLSTAEKKIVERGNDEEVD